jgi:hypothetical protein
MLAQPWMGQHIAGVQAVTAHETLKRIERRPADAFPHPMRQIEQGLEVAVQ